MCATLLCQMHPGRARCTFWPGRSKDQERPAHMAMPPRSYLQRIASTRVSASPPLRIVALGSVCRAVCVVVLLFVACTWRATFSRGVARRHVACIRKSFNRLWPALLSLRRLHRLPPTDATDTCYRNALIKPRLNRVGNEYESDDHKHLIYKPKTPLIVKKTML